jgi:hypothetical protein
MENLNLFKYSPKELSLDAFLKYFILWSVKSDNINVAKKIFLKEEDLNEDVSIINVALQVPYGKKKADMVVHFILRGKNESVVFENKTHLTTSLNQLKSYQKDDTYRYLYLKLGYVNSKENALCRATNYDPINSVKLLEIVKSVSKPDCVIKQFQEYLENDYVDVQEKIANSFDAGTIKNEMHNQDAQLFTLDKLGEKFGAFELDKSKLSALSNNYHIQYSSNTGGQPWSELVFIECSNKTPEALFWRIDKRDNKFYIRLNQYSYSKGQPDAIRNSKIARLKELRMYSNQYFSQNSNVKLGKLSNRGENEKEILIFFLDENDIKTLIDVIPDFSNSISTKYLEIIKSY